MEIRYFDCLPSTSRTAAEAARQGASHLYTVVAERQSAGRGRLSRSFFSPCGGLYFTTVLRTGLKPAQYGAVTPFAAVAVRRALSRCCGINASVKWVNDLLLDGKKLCGILAESGTDLQGRPYILLGIGINLGKTDFPPELAEIATSVPCADKDALLRAILTELADVERAVLAGDWLQEYREASAVIGRKVRIIEGERVREGTAKDILSDGALCVLLENGCTEELRGGEISLRTTQVEQS